ncbi:CAP-Gly domain-containing linker protein 1-like [Trifolium medium]|uniref:CAP-Gly domain-containing linker protein 1-like n=1 Tax=Trifolium medium TaxID=97028 RepID=A0A392MQ39_9FABA|nr:CAP-Gly domain-containing linker protein 1-like [Trifolium medium]
MNMFLPPLDEPKVLNRQIEGTRLALLRQREAGLSPRELFILYFKVFLSFEEIEAIHTPFLKIQIGPAWFKQDFPATNPDDEEDVNEIYLAFLSPTILSSRLGIAKNYLGLVGYQPNLVAQQFGLTQFVPKSLFQRKSDIVLGNSGMDEGYFNRRLKAAENESYQINPFSYDNFDYCTLEYANWWMVSTISTANEKQGNPLGSSTSTASGVSTRSRKTAVSKDKPQAAETKGRKRGKSPTIVAETSKKVKKDEPVPASTNETMNENDIPHKPVETAPSEGGNANSQVHEY